MPEPTAHPNVGIQTLLGRIIEVDENPLQKPGQHRILARQVVGGPESQQDQRLFLDKKTLRKWLEVADASLTGRVQIDMVGVETTMFQAPSGHTYQVWRIIGRMRPEESAILNLAARQARESEDL